MKRDFIYIAIILFIIGFAVKANRAPNQFFYFEEEVRHGLHYGIWANMQQINGPFVVRCFEVDSIQSRSKQFVIPKFK